MTGKRFLFERLSRGYRKMAQTEIVARNVQRIIEDRQANVERDPAATAAPGRLTTSRSVEALIDSLREDIGRGEPRLQGLQIDTAPDRRSPGRSLVLISGIVPENGRQEDFEFSFDIGMTYGV